MDLHCQLDCHQAYQLLVCPGRGMTVSRDLMDVLVTYPGFPQVVVAHPDKDTFAITLKFDSHTSAFTISAAEASRAVKAVSSALKANGAAIVVAPNGLLCGPSAPRSKWGGSYVVILGIVRL